MAYLQLGSVEDPRSIKVPGWAYENARIAGRELARRGTRAAAGKVSAPTRCGVCGGSFTIIRHGEMELQRCTKCGFARPKIESTGSITSGVVIGFALALLIDALSQ